MSKYHQNDSFLPSGAIESARKHRPLPPMSAPRSLPDYTLSPNSSSPSPKTLQRSHSSSQHTPMSPPKTRSASAEDSAAALVEDWRAYTQTLRSQHQGERAHLLADRARAEEVMEEERQLWDREREVYKAKITELEALLLSATSSSATQRLLLNLDHAQQSASLVSPTSNSVSAGGSGESTASFIPQESGRNSDGTPFYAPAPRNPSRTFDTSETSDLRVDDITAPRENAIRVTSKELTASDFGLQSPPTAPSKYELTAIPEAAVESIDISHIQPELDGVAIRLSAVSPTFAAKVLSPQRSPPKLSPDVKPPARDITSLMRDRSVSGEIRTLHVVAHPENRRLTMHAGHTPNHSLSKFSFLGDDSGNATPTQAHHDVPESSTKQEDRPHEEAKENMHQNLAEEQGDKELSGPLGLTNEPLTDDDFITKLTEKLEEERRKSEGVSPASESGSSQDRTLSPRGQRTTRRDRDGNEEDSEDGPVLKLKSSFNFGAPLGRI